LGDNRIPEKEDFVLVKHVYY